jgi:beta-xylosidase
VDGTPVVTPQTSDDFAEASLPPQWEWNYQPRAEKWSLTARPGWLRLEAFKPLQPDALLMAGNTLTQRVFETAANEVVAKFDLSGMADGQKAGLCHFSKNYAYAGVSQNGGARKLIYNNNGKTSEGPEVKGQILWLKSSWGQDGKSQFAYSEDGKNYTNLGSPYQLAWGYYRGDRIGIFCFNNQAEAGYVDVDFFQYNYSGPQKANPPTKISSL